MPVAGSCVGKGLERGKDPSGVDGHLRCLNDAESRINFINGDDARAVCLDHFDQIQRLSVHVLVDRFDFNPPDVSVSVINADQVLVLFPTGRFAAIVRVM